MSKRILLLIILFLLVGGGIYLYLTKPELLDKIDDIDKKDTIKTTLQSDFRLESIFKGESTWEYTVTGQLPNPCYSATVDSIVAESYPEQVTVTVSIVEPEPDVMCAQVIQEFEYQGTFSASEEATINLVVE